MVRFSACLPSRPAGSASQKGSAGSAFFLESEYVRTVVVSRDVQVKFAAGNVADVDFRCCANLAGRSLTALRA